MIKVVAKAIASILLELATSLIAVALMLLVTSAWVTARMVGVSWQENRVAGLIKVGRDLLAVGLDAKRRSAQNVTSDVERAE